MTHIGYYDPNAPGALNDLMRRTHFAQTPAAIDEFIYIWEMALSHLHFASLHAFSCCVPAIMRMEKKDKYKLTMLRMLHRRLYDRTPFVPFTDREIDCLKYMLSDEFSLTLSSATTVLSNLSQQTIQDQFDFDYIFAIERCMGIQEMMNDPDLKEMLLCAHLLVCERTNNPSIRKPNAVPKPQVFNELFEEIHVENTHDLVKKTADAYIELRPMCEKVLGIKNRENRDIKKTISLPLGWLKLLIREIRTGDYRFIQETQSVYYFLRSHYAKGTTPTRVRFRASVSATPAKKSKKDSIIEEIEREFCIHSDFLESAVDFQGALRSKLTRMYGLASAQKEFTNPIFYTTKMDIAEIKNNLIDAIDKMARKDKIADCKVVFLPTHEKSDMYGYPFTYGLMRNCIYISEAHLYRWSIEECMHGIQQILWKFDEFNAHTQKATPLPPPRVGIPVTEECHGSVYRYCDQGCVHMLTDVRFDELCSVHGLPFKITTACLRPNTDLGPDDMMWLFYPTVDLALEFEKSLKKG
jgi:hypothetical protein